MNVRKEKPAETDTKPAWICVMEKALRRVSLQGLTPVDERGAVIK
jgi:hypothetical protein